VRTAVLAAVLLATRVEEVFTYTVSPRLLSRSLGALAAATLITAPAAAAQRTETTLPSRGDGTTVSVVRLAAPMPPGTPTHPADCDTLSYLRIRSADGPAQASRSDAVLVAMPGILGGAEGLDITGRNTVRAAATKGKHIEFWALDRRSNCLEDHWGILLARAARNPQLAFDYYFRGKAVAGHTFAGIANGARTAWLTRVGLAQTVRDEVTVIAQELPESFRTKKLLCGGHSLGGPLTSVLAAWDFDGNPATTSDAGYKQCAGFFTLDTRLPGPSDPNNQAIASALGIADGLAGAIGGSPTITGGPPFSAEVFQIVPILGLAAELAPDAPSTLVPQLPRDDNFNSALGLLLSSTWLQALTGTPDVRTLNASNAAALASIFDDNSSVITILRAGLGLPGGAPVVPKEFPVPFGAPVTLGLFGGSRLAAPASYGPRAPVYRWRSWQQVATDPPLLAPDGQPYSSAVNEVTDVQQFARVISGDSVDFLEQYFPTRIATDLIAYWLGDHSGTLQDARYNAGTGTKRVLNLDAARGLAPMMGAAPDSPTVQTVVLPGFSHLDVGTAADRTASGQPATLPRELARFALSVVGN